MKHIELYPQRGNTTKCYEDFDWSDEDFDIEEENPFEIIGNQYFTDFLVERDLYDKFVKSVMKCGWSSTLYISSIKDINDRIQIKGSLFNVIDYLIDWNCAYELTKVKWRQISNEWNKLWRQHPSYKNIEI